MSGGHDDSSHAHTKSKESFSWLAEPRKLHRGQRDSSASMVSAESYNPSEIGEAVELAVVEEQRGTEGPVRQTYVEETPKFDNPEEMESFEPAFTPDVTDHDLGDGADEDSVFSTPTVHVGRLDTVRSYNNTRNPPELTVSTNVDSVIPPRLKRRPVSEIITSRTTLASTSPTKRGHRHGHSLSITDDLDKLMETASILTELSQAELVDRHNTITSNQSTAAASRDSFQTADDLSLSGKGELPLVIPKRPTARNLDRARQVSASHASLSRDHDLLDHSDARSGYSDQISTNTWKEEPEEEDERVVSKDAPTSPPLSPPLSPSVKLKRLQVSTKIGSALGAAGAAGADGAAGVVGAPGLTQKVKNALDTVAREPSQASSRYPSEDLVRSQEAIHSAYAQRSLSSTQSWTRLNASFSSKHRSDDLRVVNMDQMSDVLLDDETQLHDLPISRGADLIHPKREINSGTNQQNREYKQGRFAQDTVYPESADHQKEMNAPSEYPPHEQKKYISAPDISGAKETSNFGFENREIAEGDDGFYDIEDPVVISHPPRAKSVRDNTRGPHRKASKRKSRRSTHRDLAGSGPHLKPFSYNTLVNLLESMNGTVIGEEFETLNLPIQEKQIIEKIIDLLSRLTLDMVLDKNRFEIGMERLEKAHRVLEGFL